MDGPLPSDRHSILRLCGDTFGPIKLRAERGGPSFSASVQDISVKGIGIVAGCSFEPGTSLIIEKGPLRGGVPEELTVEVRHCHVLPDGGTLLGCSFSRFLTTEDVMLLR